ncbi:MAG: carboxymuconolactone decarboxylase family protein [Acidimicrobiia bacterium]
MFIDPIPEDQATGAIAQIYEGDRENLGYVPQYTQAFSHHPDAYQAWRQLISTVRGQMDLRRAELATLAAARALRSDYCSVAHAKILRDRFYDEETVLQIVSEPDRSGLDQADLAIMAFAEKAARSPISVTREDVDELRSWGLSDRDVTDVVLAVAARCFFATVIETLGAAPDAELTGSLGPDLLDSVLIGRSRAGAAPA